MNSRRSRPGETLPRRRRGSGRADGVGANRGRPAHRRLDRPRQHHRRTGAPNPLSAPPPPAPTASVRASKFDGSAESRLETSESMRAAPFHPLVADWFRETFASPTAIQTDGWAHIAAGARHADRGADRLGQDARRVPVGAQRPGRARPRRHARGPHPRRLRLAAEGARQRHPEEPAGAAGRHPRRAPRRAARRCRRSASPCAPATRRRASARCR